MKLFIPTLGTKLILTETTTVPIHHEERNFLFAKTLGLTAASKPELYLHAHYSPETRTWLPRVLNPALARRSFSLARRVFTKPLPFDVTGRCYVWKGTRYFTSAYDVEDIFGNRIPCQAPPTIPAKLPKGSVLAIDRYYIRKGNKEFDSVTFKVVSCPGFPKLKNKRFWLKLSDAVALDVKPA